MQQGEWGWGFCWPGMIEKGNVGRGCRVGVQHLCLLDFQTGPSCIYSIIEFNCVSSMGRNLKRASNGILVMLGHNPLSKEHGKCTLMKSYSICNLCNAKLWSPAVCLVQDTNTGLQALSLRPNSMPCFSVSSSFSFRQNTSKPPGWQTTVKLLCLKRSLKIQQILQVKHPVSYPSNPDISISINGMTVKERYQKLMEGLAFVRPPFIFKSTSCLLDDKLSMKD